MVLVLVVFTGVVVLWSLSATLLRRGLIHAPLAMVAAGAVFGAFSSADVAPFLNSEVALHAAEIILAVLLFVDATEVRGGIFGGEPRAAARLLFLALPLSIGLAVLAGWLLIPELSVTVLVLIACIVVPIDFAPAAEIVRERGIPARVRHLVAVESGYNDGIVAPVFAFALTLATGVGAEANPLVALRDAIPAFGTAVAAGLVIGAVTAWAGTRARLRGLTDPQAFRIGLVALPLLAYAAAVAWHANGFVAAFACGLAYKAVRSRDAVRMPAERELELIDDVSLVAGLILWFAFGASFVIVFGAAPLLDWGLVLFALLALTVLRLGPVLLALLGSPLPPRERLLVGALGPRGTATIVFGLLAYNALDEDLGGYALTVTGVTVLISVVVHGIGTPLLTRARKRTAPGSRPGS
ncbi:cation:proton antiporter domain-containing protein [Nocardia harenae]|uniref:cation:proton antiporter domain-containing protein n=1 Tax=Nocardia harenae TaxID=358707 RepID=UPI0008300F44|nr:cation:proton antiporter [Nocardia harenae]